MTDPLVSILMPVKNTSDFLKQCLDSILAQTYTNWELVAVDDGSSDDSYSILLEYAQRDNRIITLQNTGHGIIDALRLAFKECNGELITRMDSDDYMSQEKIELLARRLIQSGLNSIAVGLVKYISADSVGAGYKNYENWINQLTIGANNFDEIYKECSIPSPCWMLHKTDLERCNAFDSEIYPEDYDLAFRMKKAGLNILPVDQVVHFWRDWPLRTSRNHEYYADNRFTHLKVRHFLLQDRYIELPLILWGSGNKGKQIAKELLAYHHNFTWITNNPNKIGRDIYDVRLKSEETIEVDNRSQVIIAISAPSEQDHIAQVKKRIHWHQYFHFC